LVDIVEWGLTIHRNPVVSHDELIEDVTRTRLIKRQLNMFLANNRLFNERLLLNHIIIWFNTFSGTEAVDLLIYNMNDEEISCVMPFLEYLDIPIITDIEPNKKLKEIIGGL